MLADDRVETIEDGSVLNEYCKSWFNEEWTVLWLSSTTWSVWLAIDIFVIGEDVVIGSEEVIAINGVEVVDDVVINNDDDPCCDCFGSVCWLMTSYDW